MPDKSNGEIAKITADNLFGDYDRLVCSRSREDTGRSGWSKQPIIDRIESALTTAQSSLARQVLEELKTCDDKAVNAWIRCYLQGNLLALFSRLGVRIEE